MLRIPYISKVNLRARTHTHARTRIHICIFTYMKIGFYYVCSDST